MLYKKGDLLSNKIVLTPILHLYFNEKTTAGANFGGISTDGISKKFEACSNNFYRTAVARARDFWNSENSNSLHTVSTVAS
jgi:hypothetical protein